MNLNTKTMNICRVLFFTLNTYYLFGVYVDWSQPTSKDILISVDTSRVYGARERGYFISAVVNVTHDDIGIVDALIHCDSHEKECLERTKSDFVEKKYNCQKKPNGELHCYAGNDYGEERAFVLIAIGLFSLFVFELILNGFYRVNKAIGMMYGNPVEKQLLRNLKRGMLQGSIDINQALVDAAENGHLNVVKYLVGKGANVRAEDDVAVRYAAENGHLDVVKYLVSQGANMRAQNDYAVCGAALNGHLAIVMYLVEQGADIHADGDCAMLGAAENGHLDTVRYLVEQGANVRAQNDYAVRGAAENGHLATVQYLVEQGANVHARDDDAMRYAAENGHLDIVNYIKNLE